MGFSHKETFFRITQKTVAYKRRLRTSYFYTPNHTNRVYESKAHNTLHRVTCTASTASIYSYDRLSSWR